MVRQAVAQHHLHPGHPLLQSIDPRPQSLRHHVQVRLRLLEEHHSVPPRIGDPLVDTIEPLVDTVEALVDTIEALVDRPESLREELDELGVLIGGHGPILPLRPGPVQWRDRPIDVPDALFDWRLGRPPQVARFGLAGGVRGFTPSQSHPRAKVWVDSSHSIRGKDAMSNDWRWPESLVGVWKALTMAERRAAMTRAIEGDLGELPAWAGYRVAQRFGFRRQFVDRMSPDTLAKYAHRLIPRDPAILEVLLLEFFAEEKKDLCAAHLDALGVEHESGRPRPDSETAPPVPTEDVVAAAARGLPGAFPPRDVYLWLSVLRLQAPHLVQGIDRWGAELLDPPSAVEETDPVPVSDEPFSPPDPADALKEESEFARNNAPELDVSDDHFTTLDEVLIRAVVDATQGVEGALAREKVGDLMDEVRSLNGTRHRTYFHLGFHDALLADDLPRDLPAENLSRATWYWAGVVSGLARANRHREIAEFFDHQPPVRALLDHTTAQARLAGSLVLQALGEVGRTADAAARMSAASIAAIPGAPLTLLQEARHLLSRERATEAKGILDKLGAFVDLAEVRGADPHDRFLLEIQRRRAHGFRQLGQRGQAESLLRKILAVEHDEGIQAMIHADLGLLEADLRALSSVVLPDEREEADRLREQLARGEAHFRRSVEIDARFSAHGHFCLGVLDLLREEWKSAADHLEQALAVFDSQPERYAYGDPLVDLGGRRPSLAQRTRLYLGLVTIQQLEQVGAAADRIQRAVEHGERVPDFLLDPMIHGLALLSPEDARKVMESLVAADPTLLARLPDPDVLGRSPVLREAVRARAGDAGRSPSARARDYHLLVPYAARAGETDTVAEAMDALEQLAMEERVEVEAFLAVLERPDVYESAFNREDAVWMKATLLLQNQRSDEAISFLRGEFHQTLHSGRFGCWESAEAIVDLMREAGAPADSLQGLESALQARAAQAVDHDAGTDASRLRPVRILVCGGDERQEAMKERIRARLSDDESRITVDFENVGWSGHWNEHLARIEGRLDRYDAVVLMRYIRTMFGSRLRKALQVPWVHCNNAGLATVERSIRLAAVWARNA